jgi:acyl-CoA synthetase (AMP-forming)/AMP-acid ligase II
MDLSNEDWLEKPAVQWSEAVTLTADTVHWDAKLLGRLCPSAATNTNSNSISYRTLLNLALDLASRLPVRRPNSTIVVAIPEGPCLPIAILAVHLCKDAILVPIEPSEGMERLKHMVQDAQPVLVLCLPGSDWNMMQQTISYVASDAQLVNFVDLICQTLDESDNWPLSISVDSCIWETLDHNDDNIPRISHIVYTSGTTGIPKGCVSSKAALRHYLTVKNEAHGIDMHSTVLLASALSFDPCLSDILATVQARATLAIAPRAALLHKLSSVISDLHVTHVLCTPTLWSMVVVQPPPHDNNRPISLLQVVALGGEPIPKRLVQLWADRPNSVRLYATYGVTEACVYQTMGLVTQNDNDKQQQGGQCVGRAFPGLQFRIVAEDDSNLEAQEQDGSTGEVVLSGLQLDHLSGYLNRSDLTQSRFVRLHETLYYKTGDRGYIRDGHLFIVGRIHGQGGMVKVNGVRIELCEAEAALIDDNLNLEDPHIVVDCLAIARPTDATDGGSPKQLYAFTVLSQQCIEDLGIKWSEDFRGIVVSGGPLLALFRLRCLARLRKGTLPSIFVIIPRTPLSPTGKADRRNLPTLSECVPLEHLNGKSQSVLLRGYGKSGTMVAEVITDILNLQSCQQSMLTTCANFAMLGGDSLAATRVVRTLYADHHQVQNSRFLGGSFGSLEGAFSVSHLLLSRNLGEYVDLLDTCGVGRQGEGNQKNGHLPELSQSTPTMESQIVPRQVQEYDALLEAITIGQTTIAIGLLDAGVDPNAGNHGGRLGKVSSRNDRKKLFTSNPLHVACTKGNPRIVRKLLSKGCKFNSPDASGNFPLHMTASGISDVSDVHDAEQDDLDRTECVKLLLNAGAPLSMKDGNKQTVLHAAARAGHSHMLKYLLTQWKLGLDDGRVKYYDSKHKGGKIDWLDKWYRTPVHWAVLNCRVGALEVLLREGCSATPPSPSNRGASKGTSVKTESPIEIYQRLCNASDPRWMKIRELLLQFSEPSCIDAADL